MRDVHPLRLANPRVLPKANVRNEIHAQRTVPHFWVKHRLIDDHGNEIHSRRQLENKPSHSVYQQIPLAVLLRILHSHGLQAKKPDDDPRDMVRARKLASDDFRQPFDANIRDDSFSR